MTPPTHELPTAVPPGELHLLPFPRQPDGRSDRRIYRFHGDATREPIHTIHHNHISLPDLNRSPDAPPFRLKILHINDLHGRISHLTRDSSQPIFSRIVHRLQQIRRRYRDNPHAADLFLSAGDDMVGTLFDELLGFHPQAYTRHAGYAVYSAAGLDACAIGNHDLDFGVEMLAQAIRREAHFPVLSANISDAPALTPFISPAALLVAKGLRVGIVGLTIPGPVQCAPDELTLTDPLTAVHHLLPALRPFCHILILLSHLGYSQAAIGGVGDVELAQQIDPGAFDLIIGSHTHNVLNDAGLIPRHIVNNIPIVQAGAWGRFMGEATITLRRVPAVSEARLVATADLPVAETFEETAVAPLLQQVEPEARRVLGPIDPHPDFTAEVVRSDFAQRESALANFITDGLLARVRAHRPAVDFAMTDAAIMYEGLPDGVLTLADWFPLMPYADTLYLFRLTGRQLRRLLQDNAARADRPGEPHTERGFLQFSRQIRYTIRLGDSRTAAEADSITVSGRPLSDLFDEELTAVGHSFLRLLSRPWQQTSAADHLPLVDINRWRWESTGLFLRREMVQYIQDRGGVTAAAGGKRDGRLRFTHPKMNAG